MKSLTRALVGVTLLFAIQPGLTLGQSESRSTCELIRQIELPDVRIGNAAPAPEPTSICKVDGVIGKEIGFSLWLPERWNGRFLMLGGGGSGGFIRPPPAPWLAQGYAIAATDTGHVGTGAGFAWAIGEMERQLNFAHLAVHRTAVVAKSLLRSYYGRYPNKNLFFGCSDGGRQALQEAQRYPEDFDGIVAGSPVINIPQHQSNQITIGRLMFPNGPGEPTLRLSALNALKAAVLNACDASDGLKDGVINDPPSCNFNPRTLACKTPNTDACLNAQELAIAEAIYGGARIEGKSVAPGYSPGGEVPEPGGWGWFRGGDSASKAMLPPGVPSFSYSLSGDPQLEGKPGAFYERDASGRFVRDLAVLTKSPTLMAVTMSPTSTDLTAFRARGGKLLLFHGWADTSLPPRMTLEYVDAVYARDSTARNDVRLFLQPGAIHCAGLGGPGVDVSSGPTQVDFLDAIDAWVSGSAAPGELVARFADGKGARKVCAYPTRLTFKGGDGRSPEQFECR